MAYTRNIGVEDLASIKYYSAVYPVAAWHGDARASEFGARVRVCYSVAWRRKLI